MTGTASRVPPTTTTTVKAAKDDAMMTHLIAEIVEGPAHPNLWNPTILGVLVVLSAIGLFCGSAYLLLATNLGGRLGFLVAFASLTGFMVLLTTLWLDVGQQRYRPAARALAVVVGRRGR